MPKLPRFWNADSDRDWYAEIQQEDSERGPQGRRLTDAEFEEILNYAEDHKKNGNVKVEAPKERRRA